MTAELFNIVGTDVGAVQGYFTGGGIVEAEEEGAYVSVRRLGGEGRRRRGEEVLIVDFPPPEGPTIETFMPGSISNVRSLKIVTLGLVGYENATNPLTENIHCPYHVRI